MPKGRAIRGFAIIHTPTNFPREFFYSREAAEHRLVLGAAEFMDAAVRQVTVTIWDEDLDYKKPPHTQV